MTGFVGGGNMAEALIRGMTRKGMRDIIVSEPRKERRTHLESSYGIKTTPDNLDAVKSSNIIILAVKPQQMEAVLKEISDSVSSDKAVVSIAAGITLGYLKNFLKTEKIIRAMPNIAATAGEGMTALSLCECFTGSEINSVKEIFMSAGRVLMMPEKHMNAVTALSGSGPAFIAFFAGSMIKTAVEMGLREDDAYALAVQTLAGTAVLLNEGLRPDDLIKAVKSPGGTTEAGLKVFADKGLQAIVKEALKAAKERAGELAK